MSSLGGDDNVELVSSVEWSRESTGPRAVAAAGVGHDAVEDDRHLIGRSHGEAGRFRENAIVSRRVLLRNLYTVAFISVISFHLISSRLTPFSDLLRRGYDQ